MKLHKDSHLDHGITDAQLGNLLERFEGRRGFFIATAELPAELGDVPCNLFGPAMGDEPVGESDVVYRARGDREWKSRIIEVAYPRRSRKVTVIAGPHDGDDCVLYTAYGGPQAPQETGDLKAQKNAIEARRIKLSDLSDEHRELTATRDALREKLKASREFWSQHALIEIVGVK